MRQVDDLGAAAPAGQPGAALTKMRALILDVDAPAREQLRSLLGDALDVEIVAEAGDWRTAREIIRQERPDLVVLEAALGGPDLAEFFQPAAVRPAPLVIAVAARAQDILAVLDLQALDYLLKPIEPARFQRALQRARDHLAARSAGRIRQQLLDLLEKADPPAPSPSRVKVKTDDGILFLPVNDIDWVESLDNYVVIHAGKRAFTLRETLRAVEAALGPAGLVRISRSTLANANHIAELRYVSKDQSVVVLRNGSRLPSRRAVAELEELLNGPHPVSLVHAPAAAPRLGFGSPRECVAA